MSVLAALDRIAEELRLLRQHLAGVPQAAPAVPVVSVPCRDRLDVSSLELAAGGEGSRPSFPPPGQVVWTEERRALMRADYVRLGPVRLLPMLRALPGAPIRGACTLRREASEMRLRRGRESARTPEREALLRARYATEGGRVLTALNELPGPAMSVTGVCQWAHALGLSTRTRPEGRRDSPGPAVAAAPGAPPVVRAVPLPPAPRPPVDVLAGLTAAQIEIVRVDTIGGCRAEAIARNASRCPGGRRVTPEEIPAIATALRARLREAA